MKIKNSAFLSAPSFESDDARWLTPTMINARASMMGAELNYLTFQHMDSMFATRTVKASSAAWALPSKPLNLGNEFLFQDQPLSLNDFLEKTSTNALLVIHRGAIAAEIYRNGSNERTRFMSFSTAKSVLSAMIGVALEEGKIRSLDDRVIDYLTDWTHSAYAQVTVRDLLRMRSGVTWSEIFHFDDKAQPTEVMEVHNNSLVAYKYRWCDYARDKAKKSHEPGEVFNYSTLDTSVLGCILEKAVGLTGADYLSQKIWQPAGMEDDAYYILDGPDRIGREFYGAGLSARLRDYGRFGLTMLNDGFANNRQVIPSAWVRESTAPMNGSGPVSADGYFGYAYQWWSLFGSDAYSARGLFSQFIYIDPSVKVVIVKLAATPQPGMWAEENIEFFRKIVLNLQRQK